MRAVEPPRQELFRRLNMAPYGTRELVHMRSDVIRLSKHAPHLRLVDADLAHLLGSWFNRGFLRLERIEWSSPALILEKLITYESVHEIKGWHDLRRRLAPDRRCFAFFHPALPDEPLIFVEVALVPGIATSVAPLLDHGSSIVNPRHADTAIFYSINNTQHGLRGISFGNFLVKQVLTELQQELPWLTTFATLSPIPGLATALQEIAAGRLGDGLDRELLDRILANFSDVLHGITGIDNPTQAFFASLEGKHVEQREALAPVLRSVVLAYLSMARRHDGTVHDAVAAFHLANGAAIERINPFADQSEVGYRHAYGCMVNYLYDPETVVVNHERFVNTGQITLSKTLAREYAKIKSLRVIKGNVANAHGGSS